MYVASDGTKFYNGESSPPPWPLMIYSYACHSVSAYRLADWVAMNLVVIHDSVEGLDPHGVYISIQNNPLWGLIGVVGEVSHDAGIQACKENSALLKLFVGGEE